MKNFSIIVFILFLINNLEFTEIKAHEKHFRSSRSLIDFFLDYKKCFVDNKSKNESVFSNRVFTVTYCLSTRKIPGPTCINQYSLINFEKLDFDVSKRTVFIIHGFATHGNELWVRAMAESLLEWKDVNVIAVNWAKGASLLINYKNVAKNTQIVGNKIAKFISDLVNLATMLGFSRPFGPLHMIGHSLGAHVSSFAAKTLKKNNIPWQVQRITGLDPAQPCFSDVGPDLRLDVSDAPFVDVIHSNIKINNKAGLGLPDPIGHIDIYPNGGREQPGCKKRTNSTLTALKTMICDHKRAFELFTESVLFSSEKYSSLFKCSIKAFEWDRNWLSLPSNINISEICAKKNCIELGINAEKYKDIYKGSFFTVTGSKWPLCEVDDDAKAEFNVLIKESKKNSKEKALGKFGSANYKTLDFSDI